ncbi:MAG: alpha-2-macroglobulin family protein [Chitinophagaceae bacterium]
MRLIKFALFTFCFLLFIQAGGQNTTRNYDSLWKKTDDLIEKKGLTKSALAEVKKIYVLAKKENQDAQLIKTLLYQVVLQELLDNVEAQNLPDLEKEVGNMREPASYILNSLLAEKYLLYLQTHRWQLYERTRTTEYKNDDISTWGISDFHEKITQLYTASIRNQQLLKQTRLEPYDVLIVKGNTRHLRPTLFDLLANRALDYFRNDERDIIKPAYSFQITDERYLAPAPIFSKLKIATADSLSLHHQALLLYQELLSFHAGDTRPDAYIDADLHRIRFVYQHGNMENKEALYAKALQDLITKFPGEPVAAQVMYLLAQWHADRAAGYDPFTDTSKRFEYIRAKTLIDQLLQQKSESEGKSNALRLLREIERERLQLTTEKVNTPGQPFRTLVSYRNLKQIFCRIIPLKDDLKDQLHNRYDDNYWKQVSTVTPIRTWNQPLPATNDYQNHSVEIKIDALPPGEYILLVSAKQNFPLPNNILAVQYFYASEISYVNNGNEYFLLHRETGKPLSKATVQVWHQQYDYTLRRNGLIKGERLVSDENGYFKLAVNKPRQEGIRLDIRHANDQLFMEEQFYTYYRDGNAGEDRTGASTAEFEQKHARVFYFTDRSIYRPGQTVYFKGIAITRNNDRRTSKVLADYKTWVKLFNANGEQSDSLEVKTNEFGAYSGSFVLPTTVLNGQFRITDQENKGNVFIAVEAYKRPKFFIEYNKPKGTYQVNDSITISGSAKSYAGNNINGARVKYRVIRQPRFIYPWLYWRWGFPRTSGMEITNGYLETDSEGNFYIRFKAIPDLTVNKAFDPVFDYKIMTDITDINGETRNGEMTVTVSYKTVQINISAPSSKTIATDSLNHIIVRTQNFSGEFQPALVQVSIYRLQTPERLIRKRYWQQPDQFVMSREEYVKLFPYDEYQQESDQRSWNKQVLVFSITDSITENKRIGIRNTKFEEGWYAIEAATKDKYGSEVRDIRYIQLFDEKGKGFGSSQYAFKAQRYNIIQPGDKSVITIGSSASDLFIIQQIDSSREKKVGSPEPGGGNQETERDAGTGSIYRFVNLSNEKKSFAFTVSEKDRGGFGVYHFFVKHNRFYFVSNQVSVPWTNKELTISYETFRDKTLPGNEEKWKLKISGYKKEKLAAAMLASMYDASLDQFTPHSWSLPDIWPQHSSRESWTGNYNFIVVNSQEIFKQANDLKYPVKEYDRLALKQFNRPYARLRASAGINGESLDVQSAPVAEGTLNMTLAQTEQNKVAGDREMRKQAPTGTPKEDDQSAPFSTPDQSPVQIRRNFNETAFFLPDLKTDTAGNIEFVFTIPEALTRWKFQALAYTKEAAFGYSTKDIITQKQFMVQPNVPRFLREGDRMALSTKIVNLTGKDLTGTVQLELLDAASMQPVDGWFQNMTANQYFTAEAGKSTVASFNIQVPYQYKTALIYRFVARSAIASAGSGEGALSDGEESALPVVTNNTLVTESLPLPVRGTAVKKARFEKLLQSGGGSETLKHHSLTVEFTTNPAWYAVQSLPYLLENPNESSEQAFNRFYANALAARIASTIPTPPSQGGEPGKGLMNDPGLKSILLEETPWVLEAKSAAEQQKNVALLFDRASMIKNGQSSLDKLARLQSPNGGFMWFEGGPDDRFITQYILTGIGRLKRLQAWPVSSGNGNSMIAAAVAYLDKRLKEDYLLRKQKGKNAPPQYIDGLQVQYLYMRSFFKELPVPGETVEALNYYRKQSQQLWLTQNKYLQGMIALALARSGDSKTANAILRSLKENAIVDEELGMYWKDNRIGYYWYQAPVETQSLLIEAFSEIARDTQTVDNLKTWLLKQKQLHHWKTTKATADACYALLLLGSDWLSAEPVVEINLGDKHVVSNEEKQETGTGYFRKTFEGAFVNASMGQISVKVQNSPNSSGKGQQPSSRHSVGVAWGAVYWQYFENLDNITSSATPLKLAKRLFIEKHSDRGPVLQPISDGEVLKTGDKVKVRIVLKVDRDMEYVHMKDMRASCMEPVNVLSAYKWQGGLGYYETTRDASTSFFFHWLPRGEYVFEYLLFVTHTGNFSSGITSIQSMYAPEFGSHSEGVRVSVE